MADPQISTLATSPAAVVWSNGALFDGFVLLTLTLPTGYTQHFLKNSSVALPIPRYTRVPVVAGGIDTSTGLYYNSDINPPGTQYSATFYDTAGNLIASVSGGNFSISALVTTLTVPVLTVPV